MLDALFAEHSWSELWGPVYFVICLLICYWYFQKVVRFYRSRMTNRQISYFISAVILLYIVKGTPIATIAKHYLFSAHVLQLSVLFFIVIPLFILSLPTSFIRSYFWHHRTRLFVNILGRPWLNAILFNGLVTIYFIPSVFNTIQEHIILMFISQMILIVLAFSMWWVIISPIPEISDIPYLTRILYIFFASVILMPIGIFFLIIQKAHYPVYDAVAGELIPILSAIDDQQLAGGALKVIQLSSYIIALLSIVLMWGREEEEKEGQVDDENIRVVQGVVIHLNDKK